MKRDLLVGVAQWLASPGQPKENLSVALGMMENAAARGVELVVLPELWSCGYDPESLASDARHDAEPRQGPRTERLAKAARTLGLYLAAGSVPELDDGHVYNTALVFNPRGELVAWHRKAHLYPPTLEPAVFTPATASPASRTRRWVGWAWSSGSTATFPRWPGPWPCAGSVWSWLPRAYEVEGSPAWDLLHPAVALTNGQWWVQANQAGSHATSTLLGQSRIIAPTGTVVAEASGAVPGRATPAELLVHRIDLHLAYKREGESALLEDERRPELYAELGEGLPTAS